MWTRFLGLWFLAFFFLVGIIGLFSYIVDRGDWGELVGGCS